MRKCRKMTKAIRDCEKTLTNRTARVYLTSLKRRLKEFCDTARAVNDDIQSRTIERANRGRKGHAFKLEDLVVVSMTETRVGNKRKLMPHWQGPWVVEEISTRTPSNLTCRSLFDGRVEVFHANRLKIFQSDDAVRLAILKAAR